MPIALLHERELHSFPLALTAAFLYYNPMQLPRRIPSLDEIRTQLMPLFRDAGLQLAVLFGSAAQGQAGPRSDVDIALLYDDRIDPVQLTNRITQLLRNDAVDVVDLRTASPLLRFAALRDGKLLYERSPGIFHSVYSLAFRRYVDTKKLREALTASIRNYLVRQGTA